MILDTLAHAMPSQQDKTAFSQRLKQALKRSPKKIDSPTELALNFNLRHRGDPVTPQAAQKWLAGTSLPTYEKIATLADWLNVSLQWLRYGIAEDKPVAKAPRKALKAKAIPSVPTADELKLLTALRAMPEHRRNLVLEIVEQFSLEQEMWRD
jgi:transcriptional regulator with XRE-family HTH domain